MTVILIWNALAHETKRNYSTFDMPTFETLSNAFLEYSNDSGRSYASPEFSMEVQACIPAALCAIHNFIQCLDSDIFFTPKFQVQHLEEMQLVEVQGDADGARVLAGGPFTTAEQQRAAQQWDFIAQWIWEDYMRELRQPGHV